MSYNINDIEKIDEFQNLYKLTKLVYCLPFELNMRLSQLQCQLTESFELSYFAADHSWYHKHLDSSFEKSLDTGIKINILLVVNNDKEVDEKYGELTLYEADSG